MSNNNQSNEIIKINQKLTVNQLLELESKPLDLEQWAVYMKPDTRFADPYTKGHMDFLKERLIQLDADLNGYHASGCKHTNMETINASNVEQLLWTDLEEMILMAKALQIALVG